MSYISDLNYLHNDFDSPKYPPDIQMLLALKLVVEKIRARGYLRSEELQKIEELISRIEGL